ncbi:40S ribosomal protein S15 [Nymphaea thermarum]|nr:40S ribosomal protein S15 [Nymphaea thermarum]
MTTTIPLTKSGHYSARLKFCIYRVDVETEEVADGQTKRRTFKKFSFRGVDLDGLLDMPIGELVKLFHAWARRWF